MVWYPSCIYSNSINTKIEKYIMQSQYRYKIFDYALHSILISQKKKSIYFEITFEIIFKHSK